MDKTRLSVVVFIEKNWSKSFNNGIFYNRVGFQCIHTTKLRQTSQLFHKLFAGATECGKKSLMGGCNLGEISHVRKCHIGKSHFFLIRNFQSRLNSTICNPVFTLPLRMLLKPWTLFFKKHIFTAIVVSQLKGLKRHKKLRYTFEMKVMVLHSLVQNWETFSKALLAMLTTLSAYTLLWYTRT